LAPLGVEDFAAVLGVFLAAVRELHAQDR